MEIAKTLDPFPDFGSLKSTLTAPAALSSLSPLQQRDLTTSGKSLKSVVSQVKPNKDGANVLSHSQVYREIFEAEVHLTRTIELTRHQRATKPPPEPDTSTKKTHLPAVNNLPPGGPQVGLLTQNGKKWMSLSPNNMLEENPVLAKQRKQLHRLSEIQNGAEQRDIEREVMDLPSNIRATKLNSDIIERITEKRLAKHNALLEEMHQKLSILNQSLEPHVETECVRISECHSETNEKVEKILSKIKEDRLLLHLNYFDLLEIWNEIMRECTQLAQLIHEMDGRLQHVEADRVFSLRKSLGHYSEIMERVSHLSPGDLHKIIDEELLSLNQSLIANQRDLADLKARLLLLCIDLEKQSRILWEKRVLKWKQLHIDISKEDFRSFMTASNVEHPPEILDLIHKLQEEQRNINGRRKEEMQRLVREFIPPQTSKQFVYDWNQKVLNLSQELDGVNQKYLKLIYQEYENVTQRCLDKMRAMQMTLIERSLCTEEEAANLINEFCFPFIGSIQSKYEERMEAMDKHFEQETKLTAKYLKNLFKFLLGIGHLWDKHELALDGQERKLQERLMASRNTHSNQNQEKEAQLDLLMDRMRQESSEDSLKDVLKRALDVLDKLKISYTQFHGHQVHFVKGYPSIVLAEVESYGNMLAKYFGCKREKEISGEEKINPPTKASSRTGGSHSGRSHHQTTSTSGTGNARARLGVSLDSLTQRSTKPTITGSVSMETIPSPGLANASQSSFTDDGESHEQGETHEATLSPKPVEAVSVRRKSLRTKKSKVTASQQKPIEKEYIITEKGTRYVIKYDNHGVIKVNKKEPSQTTTAAAVQENTSTNQAVAPTALKISVQVGFILPLESESTHHDKEHLIYIEEMLLSEAFIREVKLRLRQRLLTHLDQWQEEALQKSRQIVAAKTEELDAELQLRLHLHEPRSRRAEMDVHNVRAAELLLHSERVSRHCKGVTQALTELKHQLNTLQEEHNKWENQFKLHLEEMDQTFSNATKSSKIANMSSRLNNEVNTFMDKIRSSLQKFRQKVDEKLQMLQEANSNFIRSFKLFSEGGNFCPEEVDEFRKRLEKVAHKIEQSEATVISEMEGMEKRRQDSAILFSKSFEERFKNNLLDLVFVEKMTRWFTNAQMNIKSEVSDSNSQTRRLLEYLQQIKDRIDAVRQPTVDKEKITASELSRSLLQTFQAFQDRAIYLNCVKPQLRPPSPSKTEQGGAAAVSGTGIRVGFVPQPTPVSKPGKLALDDPSISIIRGILKTQKMRVSTAGMEGAGQGNMENESGRAKKGEANSSQLMSSSQQYLSGNTFGTASTSNVMDAASVAGGSAAAQESRRNSFENVGASAGPGKRKDSAKGKYVAKNQRLDKKYLIFGESEISPEESKHFLGRIKEICRQSLEGMLFVAEIFYRTKGARQVTRPQVMQPTFDQCAEAVIKKIQSFYQQTEVYHNSCIKEFRNQLVQLETIVKEVPLLVLDEGYSRIVKDCDNKLDILREQYRQRIGELEVEKLRLENALRPDLGHPQKAQELASVIQQLEQRHENVLQTIKEHIQACEIVLLQAGREFVKMISSQSEQLFLQFDNLLTVDDVDKGRFDPPKHPTSELLRRKYCGEPLLEDEHATLIPRGKKTWPSISVAEFLTLPNSNVSLGTLQQQQAEIFKASVTVITAQTTMAHNSTAEGREECLRKFRQVFQGYAESFRDQQNKDTIMENRWNQSLHRSVQSIIKLYA